MSDTNSRPLLTLFASIETEKSHENASRFPAWKAIEITEIACRTEKKMG